MTFYNRRKWRRRFTPVLWMAVGAAIAVFALPLFPASAKDWIGQGQEIVAELVDSFEDNSLVVIQSPNEIAQSNKADSVPSPVKAQRVVESVVETSQQVSAINPSNGVESQRVQPSESECSSIPIGTEAFDVNFTEAEYVLDKESRESILVKVAITDKFYDLRRLCVQNKPLGLYVAYRLFHNGQVALGMEKSWLQRDVEVFTTVAAFPRRSKGGGMVSDYLRKINQIQAQYEADLEAAKEKVGTAQPFVPPSSTELEDAKADAALEIVKAYLSTEAAVVIK